jgi:hypothetical protein
MTIQENILSTLAARGGTYAGTDQISQELPANKVATIRAMRKCIKNNLVKVKRKGGGAGNLTVYRLTSKGLKYVQSK